MISRSYCREALSEAEDIYPHTDIPDDDAPPVNGPEDYGFANGRPNGHDDSIIPELDDLGAGNVLNWADMSNWDNEPVPRTRVGYPRPRATQSSRPLLRRRWHRQVNHRADEERGARHRQGVAWLNAGAGSGILYRCRRR